TYTLTVLSQVMSTPTYVDSETITQADRAQSTRVPVPLPDDPNVAVRQAQLVAIDTESDLEEAPLEEEELHPLVSSDSTAPLSLDHLLTHVSPTPTPTSVSSHRRTSCMTVRAQPAMSPGYSARVAEVMALSDSAFRKRGTSWEMRILRRMKRMRVRMQMTKERSDGEGHGLGDDDHGLDDESQGLEDEGASLEEEEAVPEVSSGGGPDTEDDRVYTDVPAYAPPVVPVQTPPSPEWSLGSLLVSPSSPVVPSPIASLVATPTATISVDEDQFIEVGAQLELHGSILHDHTQRLDALPPTLVANIDRDVRELYTRSGVVRDEIFSQRYMFRSLEREQERTIMTFGALWRPVLALEAWAGRVDTRMADMSRAGYDGPRTNS
ncbi:hypothetical protein Tco_1023622, partial [Tanacetum coccineum]